MTPFFTHWRNGLAWAALAVLLSACDNSENTPTPTPPTPAPPHTTYTQAGWDVLPAVTDSDLQAGFASWRSACVRLKADAVWGATCAAADQRFCIDRALSTLAGQKSLHENRTAHDTFLHTLA